LKTHGKGGNKGIEEKKKGKNRTVGGKVDKKQAKKKGRAPRAIAKSTQREWKKVGEKNCEFEKGKKKHERWREGKGYQGALNKKGGPNNIG